MPQKIKRKKERAFYFSTHPPILFLIPAGRYLVERGGHRDGTVASVDAWYCFKIERGGGALDTLYIVVDEGMWGVGIKFSFPVSFNLGFLSLVSVAPPSL